MEQINKNYAKFYCFINKLKKKNMFYIHIHNNSATEDLIFENEINHIISYRRADKIYIWKHLNLYKSGRQMPKNIASKCIFTCNRNTTHLAQGYSHYLN